MRALKFFCLFWAWKASAAIPTLALPNILSPQVLSFNKSADDPNIIRVSLGTYQWSSIRGEDLSVDGKSLGVGAIEIPVSCDGDFETPIKLQGIGAAASPANFESPSGFVRFNSRLYRAKITIFAQNGICLFVNTLPMDQYLASLLNKEMSPSWPLEALKAQAVASRSYALYQKKIRREYDWDVESTTSDQVYEGAESETPRSHLAVQATAKLILSWKQEPIKAYFHANCGGQTELPSHVWGAKYAYFQPVICPYHKDAQNQVRWTYAITRENLGRLIKKVAGLIPKNFIRVASVSAAPLVGSQRLQRVKLLDSSGKETIIGANDFRNALGNTKVKSTAFTVQSIGDEVVLKGQGFGHGVGLCQVGAKEMARQGKTFSNILKQYYPLAKLTHFQ